MFFFQKQKPVESALINQKVSKDPVHDAYFEVQHFFIQDLRSMFPDLL